MIAFPYRLTRAVSTINQKPLIIALKYRSDYRCEAPKNRYIACNLLITFLKPLSDLLEYTSIKNY